MSSNKPLHPMLPVLGTTVVLTHTLIALLHGMAHSGLGVELSTLQTTYAAVVIVVSPAIAAALLWTRHARLGLTLLAISLAGSLFFGLYYHYVAISPDHVAHLPPGPQQGRFQLTAALLAISELFGVIVALWGGHRVDEKA